MTEHPIPEVELRDATAGDAQPPREPVVEDINWFIRRGDYWVVCGRPGTGKSQLLATAAGMARPLRGSLRLFGRDTFDLEEEDLNALRRRVGMVFAGGGRLFRDLTVAQNIALPLAYHGEEGEVIEEQVARLLQHTELESEAGRLPGELTWGVRQRVALARALALKPDVVFLDEPLRGLDRRQMRWWLQFLQRLNAGQISPSVPAVTLVVTACELAGWTDHANCFAAIHQNRWWPLGGKRDLTTHTEPLMKEFLEA